MWSKARLLVASPVRLSSRHGCLRRHKQCTRTYSWQKYPRKELKNITVYEGMQLRDLAKSLNVNQKELCNHPELERERLNANSRLSMELAELAVISYGHLAHFPRVRDPLRMTARNLRNLKRCAPVVTVMGHVDHGKTSLLDALRKTAVAEGEAGGITQHIGAFSVKMASGDSITFLDTPGHAAFSAMRARGASVTDIVVLVVAADDGVKPQTEECIQLIKQTDVPVVVAINKCDRHTANAEKVKQQLLQYGMQLEHFGGDIQSVEISATKGTGLVELEEAILAQAELNELKADYTGRVEGVVLEVRTDRGLGSVATVLVQHGQLKRGQILVAGEVWAKIRTLFNDSGKRLNEAGPSMPVLTAGWRELPAVGELCLQMKDETGARHVIDQRAFLVKKKEELTRRKPAVDRDESEKKLLVPLIVKGDVAGSLEALLNIITAKQPEELDLEVVHSGVGPISDSDIDAAWAVGGVVLGFNVSAMKTAAISAKQRQVTILSHKVIYKLIEELKVHLKGKLPHEEKEEILGEAAVTKTFKLSGAKSAYVGGCRVKKGELVKDGIFKLLRDEEVVHEGKVSGMMRNKEDISRAKKETECGISYSADRIQFQEGDWVQCVRKHKVPPTLHWNLGF